MIAGLLKAPSKYSPAGQSGPRRRARPASCCRKMQEAGFIAEDEERQGRPMRCRASFEPLAARASRPVQTMPSTTCMDQLRRLRDRRCRRRRRPHRRHDARAQHPGERRVNRRAVHRRARSRALSRARPRPWCSIADGACWRSSVGARIPTARFNRAVKARRQPGSAFKPFVYLAALEAGYRPDSGRRSCPSARGWARATTTATTSGRCTMRTALAKSVNAVAARLTMQVGPKRVWQAAQRLGIRSSLAKDATSRSAPRSHAARADRRLQRLRQRRSRTPSRTSCGRCARLRARCCSRGKPAGTQVVARRRLPP